MFIGDVSAVADVAIATQAPTDPGERAAAHGGAVRCRSFPK